MESNFLNEFEPDPIVSLAADYGHFAREGNISLWKIKEHFDNKEKNDVVVIKLKAASKKILNEFDLGHITHYAATEEAYKERLNIINKSAWSATNKFNSINHEEIILVLMVEGVWGLPTAKTQSVFDQWKNLKSRAEQNKGRAKDISRLYKLLNREDNFRLETRLFGDSDKKVNEILKKVIFEFSETTTNKKNRISINWPNDDFNAIGYMVLEFLRNKELREEFITQYSIYPVDPVWYKKIERKPHQLFCYRFISFLENHTKIRIPTVSRLQQFKIFIDLLKAAGYVINTDPKIVGNEEANIKKWYNEGKELQNQLELKFANLPK